MSHLYEIHVVEPEDFDEHNIGQRYKGGTIIDGLGGVNDESLLLTVVEDGE